VATARSAAATTTARSATATAVTAFGMCDRNIDQADPQRHRESRHPHDRQNGDPPFPAHSGSHPIPLQNIDPQAGHLIAAQAQVAPTLWRQTSTLRNEWK
jgi:hypothetical protein